MLEKIYHKHEQSKLVSNHLFGLKLNESAYLRFSDRLEYYRILYVLENK